MKADRVRRVLTSRTGMAVRISVAAIIFALIIAALALGGGVSYRVATGSSGIQANGESSHGTVSSDGRYVAFRSSASNLVPGDTNGSSDIFVKDTWTGQTKRVSTDANGNQLNGDSFSPQITPDGQHVVFESWGTNVVPGDTNGAEDIFVKNVWTGAVERVSVNSSGLQANGISDRPTISADGRYVAFRSVATNLVPGDTNGFIDVFVRDRQAKTTIRVSTNSAGNQATGQSGEPYWPQISAGGNHVIFESDATNLVAGDTNGAKDIFVKNIATGATTRVSTNNQGIQADAGSLAPSISADGRWVAFRSVASNLVAGKTIICNTSPCSEVFAKDTVTGQVYWASTNAGGAPADKPSWDPAISPDGRFVAYASDAANIVYGETNNTFDIFVKNILSGAVDLVSKNAATGVEGNDWSIGPMFSYDGRYVAFVSRATNLVTGDTNGVNEVFISPNEMASQDNGNQIPLASNYFWSGYDHVNGAYDWLVIGNPSAETIRAEVWIAGVKRGDYTLAPGALAYPNFPGLVGGPVELRSYVNGGSWSNPGDHRGIVASKRTIENPGTARESYREVNGVAAELAAHYYWSGYDQAHGAYDWLVIGNPSTETIRAEVWIAGVKRGDYTLAPGAVAYPYFPGLVGGPVELRSYVNGGSWSNPGDHRGIVASKRTIENSGTDRESYREVNGIPAELPAQYFWSGYDQAHGAYDWLVIGNPSAETTRAEVWIAGVKRGDYTLAPGALAYATFPGLVGGPVELRSYVNGGSWSNPGDHRGIVASKRTIENPGTARESYREVNGVAAELAAHYFWSYYDQAHGAYDWLVIGNPSAETTHAEVWIAGVKRGDYTLAPGAVAYPYFPGLVGGPVELRSYVNGGSWSNPGDHRGIVASKRTIENSGTSRESYREVNGNLRN